jgi:hypothetical protein
VEVHTRAETIGPISWLWPRRRRSRVSEEAVDRASPRSERV